MLSLDLNSGIIGAFVIGLGQISSFFSLFEVSRI